MLFADNPPLLHECARAIRYYLYRVFPLALSAHPSKIGPK